MYPSEKAYVPFVSVQEMMQFIHLIGLPEMMRGLADYIEDDFRRWPQFDKTPRLASHAPHGVIELMPTSDGEAYGFKYVNGHPSNTQSGHQTVVALGLLSDVATGYPVLLTEMTLLTAVRTAAMSALAARYLAPQDAGTMAVIGNGAQAAFQCIAMRALLGLNAVRLYDIDPLASQTCAAHLKTLGFDVTVCDSGEAAVEGAEIITTCTADKRNARVLTGNMVSAGVHINAVGGDCPGKTEVSRDVLERAAIFVEYPEQTRIEGEIQQLPPEAPVTEIWRVFSSGQPRPRLAGEVTLFDSVGFAIEDFAALRFVRDQIAALGMGQSLDLLADPDDPRDLYGMLDRARPQSQTAAKTV